MSNNAVCADSSADNGYCLFSPGHDKRVVMNKKRRVWGLALAALLTIVVWRLPFGAYLLYPLTILATWFHEMGHGLTALLLGGSFHQLTLLGDGSGLATYSGNLYGGSLAMALVAAAGPVGPALAGSLLILGSRHERWAQRALIGLASIMGLSVLLWMRNGFGVAMITGMAVLILWAALRGRAPLHIALVQLLGVNAAISVFFQIDYLFTHQVSIGGRVFLSDTGKMAEALLLPYWFWALLLTGLTLLLPFLSLRRALR